MNTFYFISILLLCLEGTFAHSTMQCAKFNTTSNACNAAPRDSVDDAANEGYLLPNDLSPGQECYTPMSNPISAAYDKGSACGGRCGVMGTFARGESHTLMWYARGHAIKNQSPGNIILYISPLERVNQGADVGMNVFRQTPICTGSFANCNGNGQTSKCIADCKMPTYLQDGIYTLMWRWDWNDDGQGIRWENYTTCADITISGGSSLTSRPGVVTPPAPLPSPSLPSSTTSPMPSLPSSTTSKTVASLPITTGSTQPSTSGSIKPSTSGKAIVNSVTTGAQIIPPIISMSSTTSTFSEPSNCAGLTVRSTSMAVITEMDYWGAGYHMIISINVAEARLSKWYLEIIYPPNQTGGSLSGAYNGGSLRCQNFYSAVLQPSLWASSPVAGDVINVEISGKNPGKLTEQAIRENTIFQVWLQ